MMGDTDYEEDDIFLKLDFDDLDRLDWDNLYTGLPDASPPLLPESSSPFNFCNSSPDSVSSWIGQLENILMKDDDDSVAVEPTHQSFNDFLADILVDSPPVVSAEVVDAATDKDSIASDNGIGSASEMENDRKNVVDDGAEVRSNGQDPDDPISKKRRRQLRNRDAAVRSRERKKMYVRDLEIKSRCLEGECRRLGRLLQCVIAENQALRLSLQKGNAIDVTSAKQESAVLLLESLLLGSLLWFLGIVCLFTLPTLPHSTLVQLSMESMEVEVPKRGAGSKIFICLEKRSFVSGRRWKASRTRMKPRFILIGVLVGGSPLLG